MFLVAASAAVAAASARAQESDAESPPRDFAAWFAAVSTHLPGQRDEPLLRIVPWLEGELETAMRGLSSQRVEARPAIVQRALVLHVDIAMLHRTHRGYDLPAGRMTTTLFQDGRTIGSMVGTFHWEIGRRLLERLPASADRDRIGRAYYRATAAVLQQWGEYPELVVHLAAARRLLGDDPVILLIEGTYHQAESGPRVQRFFDEQRRAASRVAVSTGPRAVPGDRARHVAENLPSAEAARTAAVRLFRRAIDVDPTLVEARLRLAHVLSEQGRHQQAREQLAQVSRDGLPALLDYYAALLAGRGARQDEDFDAAQRAFEHAAERYPETLAPWIGLSELAMARGDRAESLRLLLRANRAARVESDEPWWAIDRVHAPSAAELVESLRRAVTP